MGSDPKDMSLDEIMETLRQEASTCEGREFCLYEETDFEACQTSDPGEVCGLFEGQSQDLRDFLVLPFEELVEQGYTYFLNRSPDLEGKNRYLHDLRSRRLHPVDFLFRLRYGREGRAHHRKLPGLLSVAVLLHLCRIPVLGPLAGVVAAPFFLPRMLPLLFDLPVSGSRALSRLAARQGELKNDFRHITEQTLAHTQELGASIKKQAARIDEQHTRLDTVTGMLQDNELQVQSIRRQCIEANRRVAALALQKGEPAACVSAKGDEPAASDLDMFYVEFEDCFRGSREQIRQGLKCYLPFVTTSPVPMRVLDLGCGRGEWLELLAEQGVPAAGVDLNAVMVREGCQAGLDITLSDVLPHLRAQESRAFSAVTSFHLIEHLPFARLIELLDEIHRILTPGGVVILETPNPRNILVGAGDFYRDPTHKNPVFPDSLAFMARQRGFGRNNIFWKKDGELTPAAESSFDTLEDYVCVGRDYAYIGYVPCV